MEGDCDDWGAQRATLHTQPCRQHREVFPLLAGVLVSGFRVLLAQNETIKRGSNLFAVPLPSRRAAMPCKFLQIGACCLLSVRKSAVGFLARCGLTSNIWLSAVARRRCGGGRRRRLLRLLLLLALFFEHSTKHPSVSLCVRPPDRIRPTSVPFGFANGSSVLECEGYLLATAPPPPAVARGSVVLERDGFVDV